MNQDQPDTAELTSDTVPQQIFNDFLQRLNSKDISNEVVIGLKEFLQKKTNPTESELKAVLFNEEANI